MAMLTLRAEVQKCTVAHATQNRLQVLFIIHWTGVKKKQLRSGTGVQGHDVELMYCEILRNKYLLCIFIQIAENHYPFSVMDVRLK